MTIPEEDIIPPADIPAEEEGSAVENPEETSEDEEEEGGDEGQGGKKSGGGKKPGVDVKFEERLLSEEDLREYDSESLIEKLKLLAMAPLSMMVPGASAFESENELNRKLFMAQIGILNQEIQPNDVADPDLIAKLEKRHQDRQQQIKAEREQASSLTAAAASIAAVAAGIGGMPPALGETVQKKPPEAKPHIVQPKEASLDARKEIEGTKPDAEQRAKQESKQEVKVALEDDFAATKPEENYEAVPEEKPMLAVSEMLELLETGERFSDTRETQDYSQAAAGPTGLDGISTMFNAFAQMTMQDFQPEQKTDFKFPDPAPKMDTSGPMG